MVSLLDCASTIKNENRKKFIILFFSENTIKSHLGVWLCTSLEYFHIPLREMESTSQWNRWLWISSNNKIPYTHTQTHAVITTFYFTHSHSFSLCAIVFRTYGNRIATKYGHLSRQQPKWRLRSYTFSWHDRFIAEHKLTLVMCSTEFIWLKFYSVDWKHKHAAYEWKKKQHTSRSPWMSMRSANIAMCVTPQKVCQLVFTTRILRQFNGFLLMVGVVVLVVTW